MSQITELKKGTVDMMNPEEKMSRLEKINTISKKVEGKKNSIKSSKPSKFVVDQITGKNKRTNASIQDDISDIILQLTQLMWEMEKEIRIDRQLTTDLERRTNIIYEDSLQTKKQLLDFFDMQRNIREYELLLLIKTNIEFNEYKSKSRIERVLRIAHDIRRNGSLNKDNRDLLIRFLISKKIVTNKNIFAKSEIKRFVPVAMGKEDMTDLLSISSVRVEPLKMLVEKHDRLRLSDLLKMTKENYLTDIELFEELLSSES